jgi:hypothetical protein
MLLLLLYSYSFLCSIATCISLSTSTFTVLFNIFDRFPDCEDLSPPILQLDEASF